MMLLSMATSPCELALVSTPLFYVLMTSFVLLPASILCALMC